jgi:drug/metabolite transporter (DMT)-like permease
VYVLFQRGLDLSGGPLIGDLLLFVAVIAWAAYTAEGREVVGQLGAFPTIAWTFVAGTVMYLPLGLGALLVPSYRADIARASGVAWAGVAYLIVMTSVVSYLIWSWALAHLAAARVAVFNNLQPLATALMAQAFLGERVTAEFFVAAAVVIAGVLLAQWRVPDAAEEALLESPAKT